MIFNLLTFLAAFSVAGVAEWFSIVGIISIYAGAPYHAGLVLGIVLGFAKLVNTSWLYRNWKYASWKLKAPLIYFLLALMMATSMGVFGFLTKSHLEQGASTVDNSAKVERLDQQIAREKSVIADDEKVIAQLDSAINSYIGKDRTDKAVAIRRGQAPQRKQLRDDIDASQKKIDSFSEDKLKLTSEVRALQLEIGPIRYIAELFYGTGGDQTANIESAVKMFTLLIVSTLDPLAIILLIAANHQLLRRQDEKKEKAQQDVSERQAIDANVARVGAETEDNAEGVEIQSDARQEEADTVVQADGALHQEVNETRRNATVDETLPGKVLEEAERGHINEETNVTWPQVNEDIQVLQDTRIDNGEGTATEKIETVVQVSAVSTATEETEIPKDTRVNEEEETTVAGYWPARGATSNIAPAIINSPVVSRVEYSVAPDDTDSSTDMVGKTEVVEISAPKKSVKLGWENSSVLSELRGNQPHFIPVKVNEEKEQIRTPETTRVFSEIEETAPTSKSAIAKAVQEVESNRSEEVQTPADTEVTVLNGANLPAKTDKYPVKLSWLKEFKGD